MKLNKRKLQAMLGLGMVLAMALIAGGVLADKPLKACTGTYLMVIGPGPNPLSFNSEALWTFSDDGTFQGTDTAEDYVDPIFPSNIGFSHQQGGWRVADADSIVLTSLDFARDTAQGAPSTARVDANLTFSNGCQNVAGTFDLRIYFPGLDPLDINGSAFQPGDDIPLTGRIVTAP